MKPMPESDRSPPPMPTRQRSQGRILAMQALCVLDALGDDFLAQLDEFFRDSRVHAESELELPVRPEAQRFARALTEGTWRKRADYDSLLSQAVTDWSVARMSHVDRNILRLGLHELLDTTDTPPQVIINEAVELAQ